MLLSAKVIKGLVLVITSLPPDIIVLFPKLGSIFDPAIAALAFISALPIAPDVTSVPFSSGTVSVLVVLVDIPEHSKASCFVLSELSLILNPLSLVTTAVEVTELRPASVVLLLPKAIAVLPTVTELLASLELGIALVENSPVLEL